MTTTRTEMSTTNVEDCSLIGKAGLGQTDQVRKERRLHVTLTVKIK